MSGTRTAPSLNRDGAVSRAEPNQAKPNQAEPSQANQAEPSQPSRAKPSHRATANDHSVPKAITEYSFSRLVKSLAYTEDMYSPPCPNWISE